VTLDDVHGIDAVVAGGDVWLLRGRGEISARALSAGSSWRALFAPDEEHGVRTRTFYAGPREPRGVVLTTRRIYPTDGRPRQVERVDERGQREYAVVGPRPTHVELWATWVGRRGSALRLARVEYPEREIGSLAVAASERGAVVTWSVRARDERTPRLTVARFGPRGRERWRREVTLANRIVGEPRALLTRDGSSVIVVPSRSDRTLAVLGFAPDGGPRAQRRLGPFEVLPELELVECGSTLWMLTLEPGPEHARFRLDRRALLPAGPIPDGSKIYSIQVSGIPEPDEHGDLPGGEDPPSVVPTSLHAACSGSRAAVAFDSPFDDALHFEAPRGLVVVEWASP